MTSLKQGLHKCYNLVKLEKITITTKFQHTCRSFLYNINYLGTALEILFQCESYQIILLIWGKKRALT